MKKIYIFLISSVVILILLTAFLLVKKNKPSFMTGKEVVYLNDESFTTVSVSIGQYMSYDEYLVATALPTTVEKVENKVIGGKNVEVIYLGNVGVLGEKLDIRYIDTETHLNEEEYMKYMAELEDPANNPKIDDDNSTDNASDDNISEDENQESSDDSNNDDNNNDNKNQDDSNDSKENSEDNTEPQASESPSPSPEVPTEPEPTPEPTPMPSVAPTPNPGETVVVRNEAVREYVSPQNSVQKMGYVIYAPANATNNTPIFLFLHGIGQNGNSYNTFIGSLTFLKYLVNGNWTPDVIIVAPILPGGTKWINETASIDAMLNEVVNTFGGNKGNIYIGGFSAGCDSITPIAKQISFRGALYMAGYLGAVGNTVDYSTFLSLWSGKKAYYFRDSQYGAGGYGYKPDYVSACESNAPYYGVDFKHFDMNWPHRSNMIDAVLLPPYFTDKNGANCRDMLNILIYQ